MEHWQIILIAFLIFSTSIIVVAVFMLDAANLVKDTRNQAIIEINNQTIKARVASDNESRIRGLSGFGTMGMNQGMLFVFPNKGIRTFWMKEMNFPIDIIWIADRQVVGVNQNIPPEPGKEDHELTVYRSPEPVDWVLEVRAGRSIFFDVSSGDEVFARSLVPGSLEFLNP